MDATEQRKRLVLRAIVREYFASAEPVGSGTVVEKYNIRVSPATIRNDMADLEYRGFIESPYTSSGRIPTESGYRFYVDEFVRNVQRAVAEERRIARMLEHARRERDMRVKELVRAIAELTDESVFMSFGGTTYITGMTNLFRKPEFRESELLYAVSGMFDEFDKLVHRLTPKHDIDILIGAEHPFGQRLSAILTRCTAPGLGEGVLGIIGPTRMDYDANVAVIKYVRTMLSGTIKR